MYFIFLFIASWGWFALKADKSRIRELYGVMVYTSFLALFTDLLMVEYQLWSYHGLPQSDYSIPLLLDFSVYPVVAFLFIQNAPMNWIGIIKRVLVWTFFSVIFEWITLKTGSIRHHMWWSLWLSLLADLFIYLSIWGLYRAYLPAFQRFSESKDRS